MDNINIIKNILKVDNITEKYQKYYYLNNREYCCSDIILKPQFTNIKNYNYILPIKKLSDYYYEAHTNYYTEIYNKYKSVKFDKFINIQDNDSDLNLILFEYIKCFPKMRAIIVYPISNIHDIKNTEFFSFLNDNGIIHGIKTLYLNKKQVQGAIYQIYYDKSGFKNMKAIIGKQKKSNAYNKKNKFYIIFYELNGDISKIVGTDAPFKVHLRNMVRKHSGQPDDTKLNFFLHISDTFTETIELGGLFLNKNSLELLKYQRLDRILDKGFNKSLLLFMTYKNWLYQNIDTIDMNRFMLFSSVVLYSLGMRDISDLDLMINHIPNDPKFKQLINDTFFDENNFQLFDVSFKGLGDWIIGGKKEYLNEWFEIEYPQLFGAIDLQDIFLNPKFYYYYFGIKIISVKADIARRIKRSRPAAYADLIALMTFTEQIIDIPSLPDGYWLNQVYYKYTPDEIKKQLNTISNYLKYRYHIQLSIDEIKKILKIFSS